jgi:histidine triad (HIT) family protein
VAEGCLFCGIVSEELDADIVFRSDQVVAFRDINPVAPTHVLVVPTRHVRSAADLGPDDAALLTEMFGVMGQIARDEGLGKGYRIVTNIGEEAGQSVDHLHFHLLGGRPMSWPPG